MKEFLERLGCHVVAGPNGSGMSMFALWCLPEYAGAVEYVNSDLMAQVMSPLDIRLSAIKAGILTPDVWKRLAADRCQALEDDLSWMHP